MPVHLLSIVFENIARENDYSLFNNNSDLYVSLAHRTQAGLQCCSEAGSAIGAVYIGLKNRF